jgi:predicted XRE-type DNA-binding protein
MSYELKISPRDRAASRFIGKVRKELMLAAIQEKKESGISQASIAAKLGVNRSVVNRLLRGTANLTLRSVAEIAWALDWEIVFMLRKRRDRRGHNEHSLGTTMNSVAPRAPTGGTFSLAELNPGPANLR